MELAAQLEEQVSADPPVPVADSIALCKAQKAEWNLPEADILKVRGCTVHAAGLGRAHQSATWCLHPTCSAAHVFRRKPAPSAKRVGPGSQLVVHRHVCWICLRQVLWNTLIGAVSLSGKNNQQIQTAIAKQVKRYQKLLEAFSGSARLEAALMVHIQVLPSLYSSVCMLIDILQTLCTVFDIMVKPACHSARADCKSSSVLTTRLAGKLHLQRVIRKSKLQVYCYEDPKLLKLFSAVIRILYDADILDEDTIKFWYKKGSHPKVRLDCTFTSTSPELLLQLEHRLCVCEVTVPVSQPGPS